MLTPHYVAILGGYTVALIGWWLIDGLLRRFGTPTMPWTKANMYDLVNPWQELAWALLGAVGVVLVGQLWSRDWLLPAIGSGAPLIEAVNQTLIFLPIIAVPVIRRQGTATMLLPLERIGIRLVTGLLLACLALCAYHFLRSGSRSPATMARAIFAVDNIDECVQVFCEDLAIGILLFRVTAAIGRRWSIVAVAGLFAAGHIPSLISGGADMSQLSSLLLDFGLGVLALGTVLYSGDVLWFWPIHAVLDLTQFGRITGV